MTYLRTIYQQTYDFRNLTLYAAILFSSDRWLGVILQVVSTLSVFCAAITAVVQRGQDNSGVLGLALTYALSVRYHILYTNTYLHLFLLPDLTF